MGRFPGLLVTAVLLSCWPAIGASQSRKVPTIAILEPSGATAHGFCLPALRAGLADAGYVDRRNLIYEYRYAEAKPDRLPVLAAEIVSLRPDVIWTHSPAAALALKRATNDIPIVVGVTTDFLREGIAAGLARPGGNLTGFELRDMELTGKRLELLKETLPGVKRAALLLHSGTRAHAEAITDIARQARELGIVLHRVEAGDEATLVAAIASAVQSGAEALLVADVPFTALNRARVMQLAMQHKLPTISGWRIFGEAGSLISYGANVSELCRRSAGYVDRILKGAKPGDLPVQQAEKFELLINLKTARALGIEIPKAVLYRADQLVQ